VSKVRHSSTVHFRNLIPITSEFIDNGQLTLRLVQTFSAFPFNKSSIRQNIHISMDKQVLKELI
jgi:hypothetical protein